MSDEPKTIWQGSFRLLGVDVRCHVLSTGERIIEADSFAALLEAMGNPAAAFDEHELAAFVHWQKATPTPPASEGGA